MSVQPTQQDEEMLIRRLPKPSSAVVCCVPSILTLPSKKPNALVRRLDVSGAVLYVEHAVPDEVAYSSVSLTLPRLGTVRVPARVVQSFCRTAGACWIAELKFQLTDPAVRSGLVELVKALKYDNKRRASARGPL